MIKIEKLDIDKVKEIVADIKSKPNKDLTNVMDFLSQDFDETKKLIIELIGPGMLSTFFSKIDNSPPRQKYNVLGYYQFSDVTSTLSFTKHYYSGVWCQMTEDVKKELEQL